MDLKHIATLALVSILFNSCSKKDKEEDPQPEQTDIDISVINPTTGPYSTVVTITGSGFNTTAAENNVTFNGKAATVQSATSSQLVVVVPEAAGTGNVAVSWGSKSETGPVFNFIYTYTVSTFCGNGAPGFADGDAATTQFNSPSDIDIDDEGNLYVTDYYNHRIRKISPSGVSTTIAGSGVAGNADGNGVAAEFNFPISLILDEDKNMYVTDQQNFRVRKITPAGDVTTFAGSTEGYADGNGLSAQFAEVSGIVLDEFGNLFVGDQGGHRIRKISPAAVVSTVAGNGTIGFANGNGTAATFYGPTLLETDIDNNILVAEAGNNCIRIVTPDGDVGTYAGSGISGYLDGQSLTAQFASPWGIASSSNGMIYIGDSNNNRIRQIDLSGEVTTIAGSGPGFADGAGSTAKFFIPFGLVVDADGNLYVADFGNHRIRKITIQ